MNHPLSTVAGIKRALTPGTTIRLVNHIRPQASRTTVVLPKTNTVDLVTHAVNDAGKRVESHLGWPKAKQIRADENDLRTFHIDHVDGDKCVPFVTITVLESEHLDALGITR